MSRYVLLLNFTEQGVTGIKDSPARAEAFRKSIEAAGGSVEFMSWTLGSVDGVVVFSVVDETTATALVLGLRKKGMVKTTMLRAFDATEFSAIASQVM